jgi:hypothetical protein
MAQDASDLAAILGMSDGCATLGHSYGAVVALQRAVNHVGDPRHDRVGGHGRRTLA